MSSTLQVSKYLFPISKAYISLVCDTSLYFGFDLPATTGVNSPTNRLLGDLRFRWVFFGLLVGFTFLSAKNKNIKITSNAMRWLF